MIPIEFYQDIRLIEQTESQDDFLLYMIQKIEEKLFAGEYDFCNNFIKEISIEDNSKMFHIMALCATLPWKNKIPSRKKYYDDINSHFQKIVPEEANALLKGFK